MKPGMQMYDNITVRGSTDIGGVLEVFELDDGIIAADTVNGVLKDNVAYELVDGGTAAKEPNAKQVVASIPGLTDEQLSALEDAEVNRDDGGRKTVLDAIDAEQAKRKDAATLA